MAKWLALALAMFVLGAQFSFPRLFAFLGVPHVQFLELAFALPAIGLGMANWFRARSLANSWPVLACALLIWIGLTYAEPGESLRGLYYATVMTAAVPVAALIAQQCAWAFCARAFVLGSAAGVLIVGVLQIGVEGGWQHLSDLRFGAFYWGKTTYGTNPNEVGFHLAQASVLAFLLYLRSGAAKARPLGVRPGRFSLAWTLLLSAGCVLTLSRGAFVGILAGLALLAILGTRTQHLARVKELLAVAAVGLAMVVLTAVSSARTPWQGLQARLADDENLATLGDRTGIWRNVFRALEFNRKHLVIGAGTGMASRVLGHFDPGAEFDGYGRPFRSTHNLYFDWLLTYGLLGAVLGGCLLAAMGYQAVRLDRREGVVDRQAVLATVLVLGMTGVTYQHGGALAIGALVLAMLCDSPWFGRPGFVPQAANLPSRVGQVANLPWQQHPQPLLQAGWQPAPRRGIRL